MAQNTINTVIVLRNDQTTNWESSEYKLLPGEVGIGYLTRVIDGKEITNVIAKLGTDGNTAWKDLPQIEGVLEKDLILTYNFGRHTTENGFVNAGGQGMTTRQWLEDALSETKEPLITQPDFELRADGTGMGGEIGTYITALNWYGTATYGSYEYGPATGLGASNMTWAVSNDIDSSTSTLEDGTFTLAADDKIQLTQETSKTYATITSSYKLDATNAATPVNNVGAETTGKITSKEGTLTAKVNSSAYRKPFWAVLKAGKALDMTTDANGKLTKISSGSIRGLANLTTAEGTGGSGTSTGGLPSSIAVPAGSQMVIFAAKAGTKKSLKATDDKAMNAEVGFTKLASAIAVEGANGFTATDYDIWYVDWNPDKTPGYTGIGSAKQLKLSWS